MKALEGNKNHPTLSYPILFSFSYSLHLITSLHPHQREGVYVEIPTLSYSILYTQTAIHVGSFAALVPFISILIFPIKRALNL